MTDRETSKESREREIRIGKLESFDKTYFEELEGKDGWLAWGNDDYENQRYFVVMSEKGERLGIVGVYDTDSEKTITHTVVDPRFRGHGLAARMKIQMADELGLDSFVSTIDLGNTASLRAIEKVPGIQRVSDKAYEQEYNKAKFEWHRDKQDT